jgi:type IV fimbrial biogenesis protein FimT
VLAMKQRGLTLIELLIVITIVGILFAMAMPSFRTWIQSTQVRTAAESIQNGLQLARAEAVRRNVPVEFVLTNSAGDIGNITTLVANTAGPNWMVRVYQVVPPNTNADFVQGWSSTSGASNSAVASTQASIIFTSLGRLANTPLVALAPPALITVAISNSQGACTTAGVDGIRCLNVLVTSGGQVRMCDPLLARATNAQGCS